MTKEEFEDRLKEFAETLRLITQREFGPINFSVDIQTDNQGQFVIYTGLTSINGELVEFDSEESNDFHTHVEYEEGDD